MATHVGSVLPRERQRHPVNGKGPDRAGAIDIFAQRITTVARTHFLATKAAARHMVARGSGVILAFAGNGPASSARTASAS